MYKEIIKHLSPQVLTTQEIDQFFVDAEIKHGSFQIYRLTNDTGDTTENRSKYGRSTTHTPPFTVDLEPPTKAPLTFEEIAQMLISPQKGRKPFITNSWILEQTTKLLGVQTKQLDTLIGVFSVGNYRSGLDAINENHIPKKEWQLMQALLLSEIKKLDPDFK